MKKITQLCEELIKQAASTNSSSRAMVLDIRDLLLNPNLACIGFMFDSPYL